MRYLPALLVFLVGVVITAHAMATPGEQLIQSFAGGVVQGLGMALAFSAWLREERQR